MASNVRTLRMTAVEIEAVIAVAGDADEWATCLSSTENRRQASLMVRAYERGISKLREALAASEVPS